MDINQDQIALILVVAVSVGAFMEGIVKPSLKTGLPVFFRWLPEWRKSQVGVSRDSHYQRYRGHSVVLSRRVVLPTGKRVRG
jgi:hypothetical protein